MKERDHSKAIEANIKAKLGERREVCAQARALVEAHMKAHVLSWKRDVNKILLTFWKKQPRSRVVSRIIRELTKADRLVRI